MKCTMVIFSDSDKGGIQTDAKITFEWTEARNLWELGQYAPDDETRKAIVAQASPETAKIIDEAAAAMHGMTMRARFNPRMNGPHILFHDMDMDDIDLIAWAKANVREYK
jgi:hypothetical protein